MGGNGDAWLRTGILRGGLRPIARDTVCMNVCQEAAMSQSVIVVDEKDNVATALRALEPEESIQCGVGGGAAAVTIRQSIPFGHKIALTDIEAGQPVVKYGEVIGLATDRIRAGEHTHVHNVEWPQGRGDRA